MDKQLSPSTGQHNLKRLRELGVHVRRVTRAEMDLDTLVAILGTRALACRLAKHQAAGALSDDTRAHWLEVARLAEAS